MRRALRSLRVRIYWLPTEGLHKTMVGVRLGCPEVVGNAKIRDCGDWCARFFTIIVGLVNSVTTSTEHQKKRTTQTPATHVARSHLACCKSRPRSPEEMQEQSSVTRGILGCPRHARVHGKHKFPSGSHHDRCDLAALDLPGHAWDDLVQVPKLLMHMCCRAPLAGVLGLVGEPDGLLDQHAASGLLSAARQD